MHSENSYFYDNSSIHGDQMLIEVGCKVFEVNRIAYTSNPKPIDFNEIWESRIDKNSYKRANNTFDSIS